MIRRHSTTSAGLQIFVLTFLGLLFVQTAWTLVLPAFRGVDEHDHVYRASSVAEGNWRPDYIGAEKGRGDLIPVRADIVEAAAPVCDSLTYTGPDNCNPVADAPGETVLVASAAARYNPAFYALIGTLAKPFHGYPAVYAMRAAAMVLCAALCGLAVVITRRFANTKWPMVAVLVTATPMVTYSTTVAAPNGVELCSALLLWSVLLSLVRPEVATAHGRKLILIGTGSAATLATVRSIGPLWLSLILATCAVVLGRDGLRRLGSRYRPQLLVALAVVGVAGLLAVGWTLTAQPNYPSPDVRGDPGSPGKVLPFAVPRWIFQSIGVFPASNEVAPVPVYAIFVVLYLGLVVLAWRVAPSRTRAALVLIMGVSAVLPLVLTVLTWDNLGLAWQGRYGLPYAMGVFLIAGQSLDRRPPKWAALSSSSAVLAVVGTSAVACAISQIGVRDLLVEGYDYRFWTAPPGWEIALLTAVGFVLIGGAGMVSADRSGVPRPNAPLPVASMREGESRSQPDQNV